MPHLTLEYTDNLVTLDVMATLLQLNEVLLASGQFEEQDIKSRAVRRDNYQIGTTLDKRGFAHILLTLLDGRSLAVRQQLSADLLRVLCQSCQWPGDTDVQCSVDVQEINRTSYAKASVGLGRPTS